MSAGKVACQQLHIFRRLERQIMTYAGRDIRAELLFFSSPPCQDRVHEFQYLTVVGL
jgi:hypothetical protein